MDQAVRLKSPEDPGVGSNTSAADAKVLDPPVGEEDHDSIDMAI